MRPQSWMSKALLIGAGASGLGLGILNGVWFAGGRPVPAYAIALDVVLGGIGLIFLVMAQVYGQKNRDVLADEFAVAKKRYAGQQGAMTGCILNVGVVLLLSFVPGLREAFMTIWHIDSLGDAFSLGMTCIMMLFILGLLFGFIKAWLKYR